MNEQEQWTMSNTYIVFADRGPNSAVQCSADISGIASEQTSEYPQTGRQKKREKARPGQLLQGPLSGARVYVATPRSPKPGVSPLHGTTSAAGSRPVCLSIAAAEQRTQTKRSLRSRLIHLHFFAPFLLCTRCDRRRVIYGLGQ